MEELYESDVLWPDTHGCREAAPTVDTVMNAVRLSRTSPVAIPAARRGRRGTHGEEAAAAASWCGAEVVPPHVLASRRREEGEVAFSLCAGAGRTLKGRDLSHVRDSVLRMTGFIES